MKSAQPRAVNPDIVRAESSQTAPNPNIPDWARVIADFAPRDGREEAERRAMLALIAQHGDALLCRDFELAHMTSSAIIVSRDRKRTLMAFHKIYQSWAWTGGHNDGERDFQAVALREAREETGIRTLTPLRGGPSSIEVLPVWAHVKRGAWVPRHLHLNVSYLFEADEREPLRIAADENSAVGWIPVAQLAQYVSEPTMLPIYMRLIDRAND